MVMMRHCIYGNVGRISGPKMVETSKRDKNGQPTAEKIMKTVINISVAEHTDNNDSPPTWWQLALWGDNAERFLDQGIRVGAYILIDAINVTPEAYLDEKTSPPTPVAYLKGTGGYCNLLRNKDTEEVEQDNASMPSHPSESSSIEEPEKSPSSKSGKKNK